MEPSTEAWFQGLTWSREDRNNLLLEQEEHHAVQDSWPGTRSSEGKVIIEFNNLWLLKASKESLAMLDGFTSGLRLDTLKVLEFTGESKRESDEVHRLGSSRNELFADEVDLQETLAQTVDRGLGIMQISTDTLATDLGLE